jgi:uncharacterized membrane protein YfcA
VDAITFSYVLLAFLVSAFLKGITGLGFSTICLGVLTCFIDIKTTIPLVIIPSLSSNLMVMLDAGKFRETALRFWALYLCAIPGLLFGLWVLNSVESTVAKRLLGGVLVAYSIWGLRNFNFTLPKHLEKTLSAPVGFTTGLINGVTGSQVMPVLPYLLTLRLDKNTFIQGINISFTLSSFIMLAGLGNLGVLTWQKLGVSILGILPVALGILLGGRVRRLLSHDLFRKGVLILLVFLGVILMART